MTLRTLLLSALAAAALLLSGCGEAENKQKIRTLGETEGVHVEVAGLSYQVQLSRILNPTDVEDSSYLTGLPEGVRPGRDETWFAIFMRVSNPFTQPAPPAREFIIEDTQENEFTPVPLDTRANPFAYDTGQEIQPGQVVPDPNSISGEGDIQGSLILFRVKLESLNNRPLELKIEPPVASPEAQEGTIDLDV
jgi:hypothetical protein